MIDYILPILAVVIGYGVTLWFLKSNSSNFKLILTFSGAFLLATTVFELLPEMYNYYSPKKAGVFILFGIILQIVLEFFSQGAEHGHLHFSEKNQKSLPWLVFLSLFIHALLEGFPIAQHDTILFGIFIHKIPIAALISTYLIQDQLSKGKTFLCLAIFALITPLGALISKTVAIQEPTILIINAIVAGMFFHISTIILFESDKGHKFNLNKLLVIISAVTIAFFL